MTYDELKERVQMGEEFQFYYDDQSYWISRLGEVCFLTREEDGDTQEFNMVEDLFSKGRISGKSLLEIWDENGDNA